MQKEQRLLESADVARIAGVSAETVRAAADAGLIAVAARTPRGSRLFTGEAVETYRQARRSRLEARARLFERERGA